MHEHVFKPSSKLTFDTVVSDITQLHAACKKNQNLALCLDLSAVTQCDSAGLALLIEAKRLCNQQNKKLMINGMPKAVEALAQFCGVDALLNEP